MSEPKHVREVLVELLATWRSDIRSVPLRHVDEAAVTEAREAIQSREETEAQA
jgi:hypothetical protein